MSAAPASATWFGNTGLDGFSELPTLIGNLVLWLGAAGVHPMDITSAKMRAIKGRMKLCGKV